MPFEDLRGFLMVAEHGSFLSAAVAMGVSRTTLRRQVDALEAQAGVPLFRRERQGMVLTDAGRALAARGRSLEEQFSAVLRSVRDTGKHPEGEVKCLVCNGLAPGYLASTLRLFTDNWPRVRVEYDVHPAPLSTDLSGVDVVVYIGTNPPPDGWHLAPGIELPMRLLATQAYLDEFGTPQNLRELKAHRLLAWMPYGEKAPEFVSAAGAKRQLEPVFVTADVHLLHEFARANLGIAWCPDANGPELPGERLIPVLDGQLHGRTELRIAAPASLAEVPKVRVFFEAFEALRGMMVSSK